MNPLTSLFQQANAASTPNLQSNPMQMIQMLGQVKQMVGSRNPGAVQSATAAAANDLMNFSITAPIRVYRGQLSSKLQIYVNSQQVNTMNVAVEVVKE